MPRPDRLQNQRLIDFLTLLIVVRLKGEWPDWGDPVKFGLISELAGSLKNKAVGRQIATLAQRGMRG